MKSKWIFVLLLGAALAAEEDNFSSSPTGENDAFFDTAPEETGPLDNTPFLDNPVIDTIADRQPGDKELTLPVDSKVEYDSPLFDREGPSWEENATPVDPEEFDLDAAPAPLTFREKTDILLNKIAKDNAAKVPNITAVIRGLLNDYNYTVSDREFFVDKNDEWERTKNFEEIASSTRNIEKAYIECLEKLSDLNFSQENIHNCLGPNNNYVLNDIEYEKFKLIGRTEQTFKKVMLEECYVPAGEDVVMSNGCDILSQDVKDLMWLELNFYEIPNSHVEKYTKVYSKLPDVVFHNILLRLKVFYSEVVPLMKELNLHRDVVTTHIKTYVDNRKLQLSIQFKDSPRFPIPVITRHSIELTETITDPHSTNVIYPGLQYPTRDLADAPSLRQTRETLRKQIESRTKFQFKTSRLRRAI